MTKNYSSTSIEDGGREKEFGQLRKVFKKSLELSKTVFGTDKIFRTCFLREKSPYQLEWGDKRNMALLEIVLWGFTLYDKAQIIPKADAIREALIKLMLSDPHFIVKEAIYRKDNLRYRFDTWTKELREVIDSPKQPRTFSLRLKEELFEADPTCNICGQKIRSVDDSEVDHHEPYWKGGLTIDRNARLTHRYCNRKKGGKSPEAV